MCICVFMHFMLCILLRCKWPIGPFAFNKLIDWLIENGRSAAYLTETVQSVGASRSRSGLRSSSTSSMDYSLPRLRTKFGERAFSHAGPATWNALPDHIRTVADPVKFRKLLKSHHFNQAFNICWFLCFSRSFSIWLTFVMHPWSRFS